MGIEKEFQEVKLFTGFIYRDPAKYREIKERLETAFSPVDIESNEFDFNFTDYYNKEMGTPLFRRFISFETLIQPERLPGIKLLTNRFEIETECDGNRTLNLDPGYLSEANVIIATTKNYYQRVPLTKGIYAHMEYVIKGKTLHTLEWTYPDFKSEGYLDFFQQVMTLYKKKLKAMKQKTGNL
jgi:hypothetical protein